MITIRKLTKASVVPADLFQLHDRDLPWAVEEDLRHRFVVTLLPRPTGASTSSKPVAVVFVDEGLLQEKAKLTKLSRKLDQHYQVKKAWSMATERMVRLICGVVKPVRRLPSLPEAYGFVMDCEKALLKMGHAPAEVFPNKQAEKAQERRLTPLLFRAAQTLTVFRHALLERVTPKEWADFEKDCQFALNHDCAQEVVREDVKARLVCQLYLVSKTWNYLATHRWIETMSKEDRQDLRRRLKEALKDQEVTDPTAG